VKTCTSCLLEKDRLDFYPRKDRPCGLQSICKDCEKVRCSSRRVRRPRPAERTKEQLLQKRRETYNKNKTAINETRKKWIARTKITRDAVYNAWRLQNKKQIAERARLWRKVTNNKSRKKWASKNKHILNEITSRRRAARKRATPKWLTKQDRMLIRDFYLAATEFEQFAGCKLHVDHIVPLQSKDVCGLHVVWNLQLLTEVENMKKGTKLLTEVL
jgi:hypothetical protein